MTPSYDDMIDTRVRRVVRAACKGNSIAANHIRGAINAAYDDGARYLLESTVSRAHDLGLTAAEQEEACADRLRLMALDTLARAAGGGR